MALKAEFVWRTVFQTRRRKALSPIDGFYKPVQ